jgi:hypothetical protein
MHTGPRSYHDIVYGTSSTSQLTSKKSHKDSSDFFEEVYYYLLTIFLSHYKFELFDFNERFCIYS